MPSINAIFGLKMSSNLVDKPSKELLTNDMVGVEIELEGLNRIGLMRSIDPRVNVIDDGSLRNHGVEFVFNEPMYGTDTVESVRAVFRAIEEVGDRPDVSERCSIHVHLDVRDLEYKQILNLLTVYLLCEPYFFKMGGTHRMHNAYTIPLASSTSYLQALGDALSAEEGHEQRVFSNYIGSSVKYSALNVAPISAQGSVEFRHHEGTTDPDRIINWINMCLCMKRFVLGLDEPMSTEYIDRIVTGGYEEFIDSVFQGCTVDKNVDTWSSAARVSKRLASIAAKIDHTCTLSNNDTTTSNLFYTTQALVGRTPMSTSARAHLRSTYVRRDDTPTDTYTWISAHELDMSNRTTGSATVEPIDLEYTSAEDRLRRAARISERERLQRDFIQSMNNAASNLGDR